MSSFPPACDGRRSGRGASRRTKDEVKKGKPRGVWVEQDSQAPRSRTKRESGRVAQASREPVSSRTGNFRLRPEFLFFYNMKLGLGPDGATGQHPVFPGPRSIGTGGQQEPVRRPTCGVFRFAAHPHSPSQRGPVITTFRFVGRHPFPPPPDIRPLPPRLRKARSRNAYPPTVSLRGRSGVPRAPRVVSAVNVKRVWAA